MRGSRPTHEQVPYRRGRRALTIDSAPPSGRRPLKIRVSSNPADVCRPPQCVGNPPALNHHTNMLDGCSSAVLTRAPPARLRRRVFKRSCNTQSRGRRRDRVVDQELRRFAVSGRSRSGGCERREYSAAARTKSLLWQTKCSRVWIRLTDCRRLRVPHDRTTEYRCGGIHLGYGRGQNGQPHDFCGIS